MSRLNSKRWVYLIGSQATSVVKIGVSNDPEARLADLQTGSPVPLRILWKTRGAARLESALHQYFAPYWVHGEWFDFGDESAVALVATAAVLMGYRAQPALIDQPARYAVRDCTSCAGQKVRDCADLPPLLPVPRVALPVEDMPPHSARVSPALLLNGSDQRVADAVRALGPDARQKDVVEAVGFNKGTVSRVVKRLVEAGLLVRGTDGTLSSVDDGSLTDNQRHVLKVVKGGAATNAEIARETGLNPGSVDRAVKALVRDGHLVKDGTRITAVAS